MSPQARIVSPTLFNSFFLDIEDLTRKTGNFKQFPIFCSMLESAVRKVCFKVQSEWGKNVEVAPMPTKSVERFEQTDLLEAV